MCLPGGPRSWLPRECGPPHVSTVPQDAGPALEAQREWPAVGTLFALPTSFLKCISTRNSKLNFPSEEQACSLLGSWR